MTSKETIGIIGLGDLGSRIAAQSFHEGFDTVSYDNQSGFDLSIDVLPVNASLGRVTLDEIVTRADTVDYVFDNSPVIHWCAPVSALATVPVETTDGVLILNDSVMHNSLKVMNFLKTRTYRSIAVVHFLMNSHNMVVVAEESDDVAATQDHIASLGLHSSVMSVQEHDKNMAHSQAPFAVLHEMLAVELERLANSGLLTPSGEAMSEALLDRSARWTEATFQTLLSNPELPALLDSMKAMLRSKNGSA